MHNTLDNDLITIKQASEYLNISIYSLRYAIRLRKIPYSKVSGKIYFHKSVVKKWFSARLELEYHQANLKELKDTQRSLSRKLKLVIRELREGGGGSSKFAIK